jgi:hypothetical protein
MPPDAQSTELLPMSKPKAPAQAGYLDDADDATILSPHLVNRGLHGDETTVVNVLLI